VRALLLAVLLAGCASAPIKDPSALPRYEARVTTPDGWQVTVFRAPPTAAHGGGWTGTPVLLVHGTSVNRHNYVHPGSDLAGYLAALGFDVWLAEYRGDRTSVAPSPAEWRAGEWNADDIVRQDLPAILDHVQAATGKPQVWLVGHSLGGALGYMLAQGPHAGRIAGLVTLGAPGGFAHPNRLAERALKNKRLSPSSGQVPTRSLGKLAVPMLDLAPDSQLLHHVFNATNADIPALIRFVGEGLENIGRGTVDQYVRWVETGRLLGADGTDYSAGLSQITVPALVAAGRADHIVPAWTVRQGYDGLGSADKTWVVFGRGWGTVDDYGHGDLLVGLRTADEVFPVIGRWLVERVAGPEAMPVAFPEAVDDSLDDLSDGASPAG